MNNPYSPEPYVDYPNEGFNREDKLQAKCAQWFWNSFPEHRRMLFHVDNNSYNATIGSLKKSLGVVSGPSDFVFIVDEVIFIEMKLPGEKQSDEQIDFMNKVVARGHEYCVIEYYAMFTKFILKRLMQHYGRQI